MNTTNYAPHRIHVLFSYYIDPENLSDPERKQIESDTLAQLRLCRLKEAMSKFNFSFDLDIEQYTALLWNDSLTADAQDKLEEKLFDTPEALREIFLLHKQLELLPPTAPEIFSFEHTHLSSSEDNLPSFTSGSFHEQDGSSEHFAPSINEPEIQIKKQPLYFEMSSFSFARLTLFAIILLIPLSSLHLFHAHHRNIIIEDNKKLFKEMEQQLDQTKMLRKKEKEQYERHKKKQEHIQDILKRKIKDAWVARFKNEKTYHNILAKMKQKYHNILAELVTMKQQYLRDSDKRNRQLYSLYNELSSLHKKKKQIELAAREQQAEFHNTHGELLSKLGRIEEAVRRFHSGLALTGDSQRKAVLHYNIGMNKALQGKQKNALEYFEKALTFVKETKEPSPNKTLAKLHKNIGLFLHSQHRRKEAEALYRKALSMTKESEQKAEIHHLLAGIFAEQGQQMEALAELAKAHELVPKKRAELLIFAAKASESDSQHLGGSQDHEDNAKQECFSLGLQSEFHEIIRRIAPQTPLRTLEEIENCDEYKRHFERGQKIARRAALLPTKLFKQRFQGIRKQCFRESILCERLLSLLPPPSSSPSTQQVGTGLEAWYNEKTKLEHIPFHSTPSSLPSKSTSPSQ